jgi:Ca2+-binding RTX toxin-like protein
MTGGAGADTFLFDSALGKAGGVDIIADFARSQRDKIALDDAVFGALAGGLQVGEFVLGKVAKQADDHLLYDPATGSLIYDANGSGAGGATLFAKLKPGTTLTAADFVIV